VVRRLIADDRITVASFPNTDAYAALYPFLNKVILPEGVGDLAKNRPPADVALLAPKASLVVRKDLHGALKNLLLQTAAVQVHSAPGIFNRAGQFPAPEVTDLPISADACSSTSQGRPFLQNYLPFWAASLVGRLIVAHPGPGRVLSADALPAGALWLGHAPEGDAAVRRIASAGGRDGAAGQRRRRRPRWSRGSIGWSSRPTTSSCRRVSPTSSTCCATTSPWSAPG
jgi:hypothetical protein